MFVREYSMVDRTRRLDYASCSESEVRVFHSLTTYVAIHEAVGILGCLHVFLKDKVLYTVDSIL
jgi:hypothetical protein